jgi:hypothetical protein
LKNLAKDKKKKKLSTLKEFEIFELPSRALISGLSHQSSRLTVIESPAKLSF